MNVVQILNTLAGPQLLAERPRGEEGREADRYEEDVESSIDTFRACGSIGAVVVGTAIAEAGTGPPWRRRRRLVANRW